jgi:G3E family GTPase
MYFIIFSYHPIALLPNGVNGNKAISFSQDISLFIIKAAFEAWLKKHCAHPDVLRAKGFLRFDDGTTCLVQGVRTVIDYSLDIDGNSDQKKDKESTLVVIGKNGTMMGTLKVHGFAMD